MLICPNLSNPDVAREFNELKDAIGEKAAYAVWSLNNGNMIDKAANGRPSILFQSLLNNTPDRKTAIQAISKIYGLNFRNLFGDWINNPNSVQQNLDTNGQPKDSFVSTTPSIIEENTVVLDTYQLAENILSQRDAWIEQQKQDYRRLYGKDMDASLLNKLRSLYDRSKLNSEIKSALGKIALKYGLTMTADRYYKASGSKLIDKLTEYIINALSDDTFNSYRQHLTAKYLAVDGIQHKGAVANVIAAAIRGDVGITLETFDQAIARDYIRTFWYSDLVQSALDTLNDTHNKTSQQLENELVTAVTSLDWRNESRKLKLLDIVINFWTNLTNLFKKVFNPHTWSQLNKQDILDSLLAAILYQDDLNISLGVQPIYDRVDSLYQEGLNVTLSDKNILDLIKKGTRTRLKAAFARKNINQSFINRLKSELEILDTKNPNELSDLLDSINTFLEKANQELGELSEYIYGSPVRNGSKKYKGLLNTPIDSWDAQSINLINTNLLGFYYNIISNINSILQNPDSALSIVNEYLVQTASPTSNTIDLERLSNQLLLQLDDMKRDYNERIVKPMAWNYIDKYIDKQEWLQDKDSFKKRARLYFDLELTFGDIGISEVYVGFATRSRSPIVRVVQDVIANTQAAVARDSLRKGLQLVRAYEELVPFGSLISVRNFQKQFLELDRDGVPTGYFIRKTNEGLFFKDKDEYEQLLRDEMNKTLPQDKLLTTDEDGETVFPEEADETADDSIYNKYMDKLDDWLDLHCERRYKKEYYKAQRRYLHRSTIIRRNQIQREINIYLLKADIGGGLYDFYNKLTKSERNRLEQLRKLKRNLAEHYWFSVDSNKNIHIDPKTGEDLRVANELTRWNNFLSKHVKYKPDRAKLNAQLNRISDPAARALFERDNTCVHITLEFYDILASGGKKFDDQQLRDLLSRHSEIVRNLKDREGYVFPNLAEKMDLGLDGKIEVWKELQRLELEIADRKSYLIQQGHYQDLGPSAFKNIAFMFNVPGPNTGETYLTYIYKLWQNAWTTNQNLRNVFMNTFYYKDEKGRQRPLNIFLTLGPNPATGNRYLETVPISLYSSMDDASDFKNDRYDEKNQKSMLAKDSIYHNSAYDKFDPTSSTYDKKLADFLTLLEDTMKEANAILPQKALYRELLLPQVTGRTFSSLGRTTGVKDMFATLKYSLIDLNMSAEYAMNNGDTDMNVDLPRRPDGSVVLNIPIRFVRRLPNMKLLTNDVVGSIIMYYQMALNYAYKSENLPYLDAIQQAVNPENNTDKSKRLENQYKVVLNKIDQLYYGHEITSTRLDNKSNKSVGAILKAKFIRKLATVAMLGGNFTTIEVGYLDAMLLVLSEAFGGKYLTKKDLGFGLWLTFKHIPKMIGNLGRLTSNDWMIAAMLYNQLSKSNSEIFGNSDLSRVARIFNKYFVMGGYSLLDYMANSTVLGSIYHHYRLVKDPVTGKQRFMTRSNVKTLYRKLGYSDKEADKLWTNAKETLADAYYVKDGVFTVKDQYKDIVTDDLENQVYKLLHDRTAMYNGVIPTTEKAKLSQNVWGSYLLLMRGFLVNTYWDRFQTGVDYADEEKGLPTAMSEYHRDDQGYEDFATGQYQGAVFKDFIRGISKLFRAGKYMILGMDKSKHLLTDNQWYAVKRCLAELIIIATSLKLMLMSVAFARTMVPPDDDDNVWAINIINPIDKYGNEIDKPLLEFNMDGAKSKFLNFLGWKAALVCTRVFNERMTPWWPGTAMDLIKNPTTAVSWFDLITQLADFGRDLLRGNFREEVKRGGYQHMSRGTKDILTWLSFTTLNNIIKQWHTSGIKSTLNYYLGVSPIDFLVPNASDYKKQIEGTDSGQSSDVSGLEMPDMEGLDLPEMDTPDFGY